MWIKKILIPTDFSANADNAIEYILSLFKKQEVGLTFLNAYHVPVVSPEIPAGILYEAIAAGKKSSTKKLSSISESISKNSKGFTCNFLVRPEPVAEAAREITSVENIDLVAMGTHGATGIKKVLFGSNAAATITSVACPVLAIPGKAKFWQMKKMLFATDYHESDLADISSLSEIAQRFDAEITVVHMCEGREADSDLLHRFESKVRLRCNYEKITFTLLGKADILKSLDRYIEQNDIELIAMSTRKRSPFEKLFSPSITKKMVYHTSVPLLAFHSR